MQLVSSIQTEFALLARADDPLHARPIAELPQVLHVWVDGDDFARALVASDTVSGVLHLRAEGSPLIVQEGFVGGAETGPVDFDKDLA